MRRSLFLSLSACLVTTSLWAQGTIVSPPSLAAVEGDNAGYAFFYYSNMRQQHAEGELRGMKLSLSEVAWRYDYRNHVASTTGGRTWTQVTLNLSDTDWTKMVSTWTKNEYSTPVEVFNSKFAVPPKTGTPFFQPDNFGGSLAVPFKSPYAYSGNQDLLLDWLFLGGTLDNNVTWSGGTARSYYLDSDNPENTNNPNVPHCLSYVSKQTRYPTSSTCRDSAHSTSFARTDATINVYGITYSDVNKRDRAEFSMYSYYHAPNARYITAIGFAGIPNGINIGAQCNLLYINLNFPWIALGRTATAAGHSPTPHFTAVVPWQQGMRNVPIWVQTVWADSVTNAFSLSTAMHVVMPADKPKPRRIASLYHYVPTNTTGSGPYLNNDAWTPITRYAYK